MKRIPYLTLALWLSGSAAFAQEKPPNVLKPNLGGAQDELVELFGKVENRLREIDRLLSDAGAGDTRALENVGPAGLDELLKKGRSDSEQAVKDIDRILEIARQMGQQQQSSGSQGDGSQKQPGQGQPGSDPLGGQEGNTTQRENTPTEPGKGEDGKDGKGGTKPEPQEGKEPGKEPGKKQGENGDPMNPKASRNDPKNRAGGPPPQGGRDSASTTSDTRDRWGDLPVHARDVFRNEGGRDMPTQYRDWIDEYYKRLNKQGP